MCVCWYVCDAAASDDAHRMPDGGGGGGGCTAVPVRTGIFLIYCAVRHTAHNVAQRLQPTVQLFVIIRRCANEI